MSQNLNTPTLTRQDATVTPSIFIPRQGRKQYLLSSVSPYAIMAYIINQKG